jgi:DNA-binding response OmpR family regulator
MPELDYAGMSAICVDDNVLQALEGERLLKDLGFGTVSTAFSHRDALYTISTAHFDFALLDIELGGGWTSLEIAQRLRERGTVVVFASGHRFMHPTVRRLGLPVLTKPISAESVLAALEAFRVPPTGCMSAVTV